MTEHKVRDIVTLRATSSTGESLVREYGDKWLVREVDRSVLSRNLGLLVCPASFIGTDLLDYDRLDMFGGIAQNNGYCRWVKPKDDPDFEVEEATG